MEPGFLLNNKDKKKLSKKELREKLRNKILKEKIKRGGKPSKKQMKKMQQKRDDEYKVHLTGDHSSQNIYNHVLYLMEDLNKHKYDKDRLKIAKMYEKKHSFLHQNYFNIYREVCYQRLTDLNLLKQLLLQRDLQMKKELTEEEAATKVGEILTEKFVKK